MVFDVVFQGAGGGHSGFYVEGVTVGKQTGKGLAKTVKYVNNFGQLPACNCSVAP